MSSTRVAVDVMGGDHAPDVLLKGVHLACDPASEVALDPARVLLVGDEETIRAGLKKLDSGLEFEIRHASQAVGMDEKPAQALRKKPDSSIAGCVAAVKLGEAGALISMGNTGAVVGCATLGLSMLSGVRRPAIAVTLELTGQPVTLLDMGANIAPRPQDLLEYAVMGRIYATGCLGVDKPRVGLLNIGEEETKGTEVLRGAHGLLTGADLDFVGNVEGGDIFKGRADVVVTDGFTGNVVLKLLEDFAAFMMGLVLRELTEHEVQWGPQALHKVKKHIDYSEYGGALLLGVKGVVVIGHGRSDANAVSNAIHVAARALDADVNGSIVHGLASAQDGAPA